jgi:hypothetical protein
VRPSILLDRRTGAVHQMSFRRTGRYISFSIAALAIGFLEKRDTVNFNGFYAAIIAVRGVGDLRTRECRYLFYSAPNSDTVTETAAADIDLVDFDILGQDFRGFGSPVDFFN